MIAGSPTASSSGKGHRLAYSDYGEGERALVLMHGLLMNRHMFDRLAPEMASRGYRVITIDALGHGALRPPRGHAPLQHARVRRAARGADRPPRARPPGRRRHLARRERGARVRRTPTRARRARCWSRCRCSTTRSSARRSRSRPSSSACASARPVLTPLSAAPAAGAAHATYLVDIGLDWLRQDPAPSSRGARGHPVPPHRAAPLRARRDRRARAGDRPPLGPAPPVLRRRDAGRGDARTPG